MTIDCQKSLEGIDAGSLLALMRERRRRVGVVMRILRSGRFTSSVPAPAPRNARELLGLGVDGCEIGRKGRPNVNVNSSELEPHYYRGGDGSVNTASVSPTSSFATHGFFSSPSCPSPCDSCRTPISLPALQTVHTH
jgi:hypothetical protein